jgi:glucokinase
MKKVITVDLGGTKILSALLNKKNEIVCRNKIPTKYDKGNDFLVKSIAESVKALLIDSKSSEENIAAISLGVPGTVNPNTGVIGNAPNLNIRDYNIKEALQKYFTIPVIIENDVNLAALGIKKFEFKDKVNNMLVVFVGTGIGSALILNGHLYRGSTFFAGEIGHMKVQGDGSISSSSKAKTFEQIASRTAVVKSIMEDLKKGKKSILSENLNNKSQIKSKTLAKAIKKNDKVATLHIEKSCAVIGSVLGSITTLLNFDTIVLGGGVLEALNSFMLPRIESAFSKSVLTEPGKSVKLKVTKLGDDAPLYGGIALAEEFIKS